MEFRYLIRNYGVDLCFTPMVIADSFQQSEIARQIEFVSYESDRPLIVQFAASNPSIFADSAKLVSPYCEGVDLNCGCPQKWAINSGYGCCLLKYPEKVADLIKTVKRQMPKSFSVSAKIRLKEKVELTIDFARQLEAAGLTFLTVHGRYQNDRRKEPVHMDDIRSIKQSLKIPIIANGNIRSMDDAEKCFFNTRADGIMAANGLLANPALFLTMQSNKKTEDFVIQDWLAIADSSATIKLKTFQQHILLMMGGWMNRKQKDQFVKLKTKSAIINYLEVEFGLSASKNIQLPNQIKCNYSI